MRPIYHMHIPRTSGTDILREAQIAEAKCAVVAGNSLDRLSVYVPGDYEFIFPGKVERSGYNFFTGHFAANPLYELDNPIVFSIMRSPIDQYVSTITYQCMIRGERVTPEFVDRHIDNDFFSMDVHEPFFSGAPNAQSRFMMSKIVEVYDQYTDQVRAVYEQKELDIDDLKSFVSSHIVGSIIKRDRVIGRVNQVLFANCGVKLNINTEKENTSPSLTFKLSRRQLKKIREKTQIDEEVYQYIRTREEKNVAYV
jgi:hypothetical protein